MPRAKKSRPSFGPNEGKPVAQPASRGWVYRSEGKPPAEEAAAAPPPTPEPPVESSRVTTRPAEPVTVGGDPQHIVVRYSKLAAGAGLIPMPAVDVLAIGGLQLKMIADLAQCYGVPFKREQTKAIVTALAGGVTSTKLAYGAGSSVLKAIPVVGQIGGMLAMPVWGAAVTYGIGRVFIQHFELGGTIDNMDVAHAQQQLPAEVAGAQASS